MKVTEKSGNSSGHLATFGGSSWFFGWMVGVAVGSCHSHHPHQTACEAPQALRSQTPPE